MVKHKIFVKVNYCLTYVLYRKKLLFLNIFLAFLVSHCKIVFIYFIVSIVLNYLCWVVNF